MSTSTKMFKIGQHLMQLYMTTLGVNF